MTRTPVVDDKLTVTTELPIQLAVILVGLFVVVPLAIRAVNRLDVWLAGFFEWLFQLLRRKRR